VSELDERAVTEVAPIPVSPPAAPATPSSRVKVSKWDRRPPKDWRWWVGGVGKTLIAIGLMMFAFVAYQLWGTAIETARAQHALEKDFDQLLATVTPIEPAEAPDVPTTSELPDEPAPGVDDAPAPVSPEPDLGGAAPAPAPIPVADQNLPPVVDGGDAIARIEIPRIGVNDIVVAGVAKSDLKKGPGHYPETPLPGQLGNAAIAGHRTTYGQPFFSVDKLRPGDEIVVTTLTSTYVYRVTGQSIVGPSDYQVVATTDSNVATLTLTSCHPKWTARQRIIITSELDPDRSGPVGEPVLNYGQPVALAGDEVDVGAESDGDDPVLDATDPTGDPAPDDAQQNETDTDTAATGSLTETEVGAAGLVVEQDDEVIADAFSEGWFSDPGANSQVFLWGVALAAIAIGAYLLSRRARRDWVGLLVGLVPFVVALYFFYQNVNRLLPPNL
jgi:sortase A